ncbi:MAG: hypothetical protein K9M49_01470 [Candidatus Marinimicrobia bacterium]|nr:hypothetical protein [Candidatus Neomarinimicrobiota bacterium]MCF7903797.1 hypothetical protein [Candidatus Neomarinimicrobiota bacterium]
MKTKMLKRVLVAVSMLIFLTACATSETPETTPAAPMPTETMQPAPAEAANAGISYAANLKPIMLESCTPCHFPEKGKKELLDTYDATARFIDDIIYRIQLPTDSTEFMPYKSKKMPLTVDQIQLFIDWRDAGMPD